MNKREVIKFDNLKSDLRQLQSFNVKDFVDFITLLNTEYSKDDLPYIYNFILETQDNPDILLYVIKQIDKVRDERSLDKLIDLLLYKNKSMTATNEQNINEVRCQAAKVISKYKNTKSIYPLLYVLNNKNENYKLRLMCAEALGNIGDKYAVMPLIELVSNEEEKSVYVRESAVKALGMIGDIRAIEPLISILESKNGLMDKFSFLKERIVEVISKFDPYDERIFKVLKTSLKDDDSPMVRINAIEAISQSDRSEEAFNLIYNHLFGEQNEEVIEASIIALYNMKGESYILELISNENIPFIIKESASNILNDIKEGLFDDSE